MAVRLDVVGLSRSGFSRPSRNALAGVRTVRVGGFIAVADERGEVLEVATVGCSAEDDLHDRDAPGRGRLVLSPLFPSLRE